MANLSDAWGWYHFDFTKTNLNTPAKRKQWLKQLSDFLLYDTSSDCKKDFKPIVTYFTELRLDDLSDADYETTMTVAFTATGRWSYQNNMEFFDSPQMPQLRDHMLSIDGLTMTVEFQDIEGCEYMEDTHRITISEGKLTHLSDNNTSWQTIYPKKYLELGLGEAYCAVNHFVDADDLTDAQFDEVLKMDKETFFEWLRNFNN